MANVIWRAIKTSVLALLLLALVAPAGANTREAATPEEALEELAVPEGHKFAFAAYAEGVQVYRWTGTNWVFSRPEAVLFEGDGDEDEAFGIHYGGPTWETASGSWVKATLDKPFPVDPDAIPWLRLKATDSDGPGAFRGVTYIQRLYTTGGVMPTYGGTNVGEEARVPYTAWYAFYKAGK
jgi:hypothetical protein